MPSLPPGVTWLITIPITSQVHERIQAYTTLAHDTYMIPDEALGLAYLNGWIGLTLPDSQQPAFFPIAEVPRDRIANTRWRSFTPFFMPNQSTPLTQIATPGAHLIIGIDRTSDDDHTAPILALGIQPSPVQPADVYWFVAAKDYPSLTPLDPHQPVAPGIQQLAALVAETGPTAITLRLDPEGVDRAIVNQAGVDRFTQFARRHQQLWPASTLDYNHARYALTQAYPPLLAPVPITYQQAHGKSVAIDNATPLAFLPYLDGRLYTQYLPRLTSRNLNALRAYRNWELGWTIIPTPPGQDGVHAHYMARHPATGEVHPLPLHHERVGSGNGAAWTGGDGEVVWATGITVGTLYQQALDQTTIRVPHPYLVHLAPTPPDSPNGFAVGMDGHPVAVTFTYQPAPVPQPAPRAGNHELRITLPPDAAHRLRTLTEQAPHGRLAILPGPNPTGQGATGWLCYGTPGRYPTNTPSGVEAQGLADRRVVWYPITTSQPAQNSQSFTPILLGTETRLVDGDTLVVTLPTHGPATVGIHHDDDTMTLAQVDTNRAVTMPIPTWFSGDTDTPLYPGYVRPPNAHEYDGLGMDALEATH